MFWRKANKTVDEKLDKARSTFQKAKDMYEKGEIDAAISLSHAARDLFQSTKDNEGLGRAENFIGDILQSIGQHDFAEKAYVRAAAAFKDPANDAETFMELGEAHQLQGERPEALEAYERSLGLYRRLNEQAKVAQITRSIAFILYELERWAESEKYYRDALKMADETGMKELKDSITLEIGNAIAQQGRLDEARRFFEQSASQARATKDNDTLADALHSLAVTYVAEGNRKRAGELYDESLKLNLESGDRRGQAFTLYEMGVNEAELGNREKGRDLLKQAQTIYEDLGASEADLTRETLQKYS